MADTDEQIVLLDSANLVENGQIVTIDESNEVDTVEVNEDILKQALVEASEGFDQTAVEYTEENVTSVVADENQVIDAAVTVSEVGHLTQSTTDIQGESYSLVNPHGDAETIHTVQSIGQEEYVEADIGDISQPGDDVQQMQMENIVSGPTSTPLTIVTTNVAEAAPLGSSANPIRIVQQGNQYTSMQQLSNDQLTQIMQVVQQQQLAKSTSENGGATILYNPNTQSKIVYRVIYPSELHKAPDGSTTKVVTTSSLPRQIQIPKDLVTLSGATPVQKRKYTKRKQQEEEDRIDGPELTRQEKEERKRHRPRTRSGRVSKPPKHMVKDYKHIHVLDWDEEPHDDSDGGYSDFKLSDDEDASKKSQKNDTPYIHKGIGSTKSKNNKCESCEKTYIGKAGLARHYRLNPTHGKMDDEYLAQQQALKKSSANGLDMSLTDESTQDSVSSATETSTSNVVSIVSPHSVPVTTTANTTSTTVPKAAVKVKQSYQIENTPAKRKARLKDIVRQCVDEELMEVVLPRLAKVITVYEFLLMKVEKGRPMKPHVQDVYAEFEALHKQVSKMCQEYLHPLAHTDVNKSNTANVMQIPSSPLAHSLGLASGSYEVHDMPRPELPSSFQYKLLTTDPSVICAGNAKRTIEIVSHEQIVSHSPSKKAKLETIENPVVALSRGRSLLVTSTGQHITPNGASHVQIALQGQQHSTAPNGQATQVQYQVENQTLKVQSYAPPTFKLVSQSDKPVEEKKTTASVLESQESSIILTCEDASSGHEEMVNRHYIDRNGKQTVQQAISKTVGGNNKILTVQYSNAGGMISQVVTTNVSNQVVDSSRQAVTDHTEHTDTNVVSAVNTDMHVGAVGTDMHIVSAVDKENIQEDSHDITHTVNSEGQVIDSSGQVIGHAIEDSDEVVTHMVNSEGQVVDTEGNIIGQAMDADGQIIGADGQVLQTFIKHDGQHAVITSKSESEHDKGGDYRPHVVHEAIEGQTEVVEESAQPGQETVLVTEGVDGTQILLQGEDGEHQVIENANVFQTEEGLVLIQNPDGTFQIHGHSDQPIPLETVQALLAMENESHTQSDQ